MEKATMTKSMALCLGVVAHAFKWNKAGKVNAIGVHVKAPASERNLFSFVPIAIVNPTVTPTRKALDPFLLHCLLFVFGHPWNMIFSITI